MIFFFRYTKPETIKVFNLEGLIRGNIKEKTHDFYVLFEDTFRGQDIRKEQRSIYPISEILLRKQRVIRYF